jgi:Raf kinase inhibitor-like YbhB/YbcL family protein
MGSPAFGMGGPIPAKYTCDGEGKSPPLAWANLPQGTQSVALLVDDPDAPHGTFTHWVYFNIPTATSVLAEDAATNIPVLGVQGKNSKGEKGWAPPCPPSGTHHYHFKVYALRSVLTLAEPTEGDVMQAMRGRILGQGELIGTYARPTK